MIKDKLLKSVIDEQSLDYSKNNKIINKTLINLLLNYRNNFFSFFNKNKKQIDDFFENIKKDNNQNFIMENKDLIDSLFFIYGGLNLIDENEEIQPEKFNNYKVISSKQELEDFNKTLRNAETQLSGITNLNNELQFILVFYNDAELREDFYKKLLWELNKDEKMEEKDYKTNIFERLIPNSPLNANQYNYS